MVRAAGWACHPCKAHQHFSTNQFLDFPRPLGLLHVVLMSDREHNCPLVGTFEATGSIPGLGGDGEVRHVTDGGEGLTPESVCGDACEVPKLS